MHRLILIRHGESAYNADNRFTGWTDVDLTPLGMAQARAVGATLRAAGVAIDVAFTSMLKRTIRSQWIICEAMDRMWLPIVPDPRLNERHYGALTGLNKATAEREYGAAQVAAWRRSFVVAPPPMALQDARAYADDPRNRGARAGEIVLSESLEDVVRRVRPFWEELAAPALRERRGVVIQAHGNTIRALIKHLEGMSDDDIATLDVPNATPVVYEFDADMHVRRRYDMPAVSDEGRHSLF